MRMLLAGGLIVAAIGAGLLSYGALSNLWADYQDSTTGTYLEVGLPWLALAFSFAVAAIVVLRKR
jgi:hypothetical protein